MGADKITQRQIIGEFYNRLSADSGAAWIGAVSNHFNSDQSSEEYGWLQQVPAMRQWIGGRQAKSLEEFSFEIKNQHYEATLEFLTRDLRRDKTAQMQARIGEFAARANSHWASLLTTLIVDGESTTCYDGQYFFDTDHSEGNSGTNDNDISVDISALPVATGGTTTAPSVAEMQFAIATGIAQIMKFNDDQGEPANENATGFMVVCPVSFMNAAMQAVATPAQVAETQSALTALKTKFRIDVEPNPRLDANSWTTKFALFRTDSPIKALIRQEETAVQLKVKGEGSEYEFDNDAQQYGIDTWRNVGYGDYKKACLVTLA